MLTISIQAGGESRRMGQDKALISFLGQPLIQRIARRMLPIADEMIVTANQPEAYRFLELPIFPDIRIGQGALGGLYTALASASQPLVAVIACDMPFANPELIKQQARLLETEGTDVVIPRMPNGFEPLHAVYRRATCLPVIEWALNNQQLKLISWFSKVKVRSLSPEECRISDPGNLAFTNVNTPEQLTEAEELARQMC